MEKHTPGPWRVEGLGEPQPLVFGNTAQWGNRTWVCTTTNDDARLIAAAPELLDALETAFELLKGEGYRRGNNPHMEQIGAAIAKARGQE